MVSHAAPSEGSGGEEEGGRGGVAALGGHRQGGSWAMAGGQLVLWGVNEGMIGAKQHST